VIGLHRKGGDPRLGQVERDEVERAHEVAAVSVGGAWALRFLTASRAQMMPTS
jgi:hypothetical protein